MTTPSAHHTAVRLDVLEAAVATAGRAPSILNTQPWVWRITGGSVELRLDRSRQLQAVDPEGRMAILSCGVTLHHLTTALAAAGVTVELTRTPDPSDPDLLARVSATGTGPPDPAAERHLEAMQRRRTDRRPFGPERVPPEALDALRAAAAAYGTGLHDVPARQLTSLIMTAGRAGELELDDPAYRAELSAWTHRPDDAGDGVPRTTTAPVVRRTVPIRDFTPDGDALLEPGDGDDTGAMYCVLYARADTPAAWLRAGEALSATLLTAVENGLAASPMSDLIEVPTTRFALRRLLGGVGDPMIVLRFGYPVVATEPPATPRRQQAHEDGAP